MGNPLTSAFTLLSLASIFGKWWAEEATLITPENADWLLVPTIAFAVSAIFVLVWSWIGKRSKRRETNVILEAKDGNCQNIVRIQEQEPSNRPPVLFNRVLTVCSLILLTFWLLVVYLWITGRIVGQISWSWFFLFIIFAVFPILTLLNTYIWEKKYYKLGRSARAKDKTIILRGDINEVFNKCLKVIDARVRMRPNSRIIIMDRPKLIKALIEGFVISITTRRMRNNKVRIYFLSDSQWVTAKIDFGSNQRNVDRFDRLLRLEMGLSSY